MSTADLSDYDQGSVPDAGKMTFGIVVSDWNHDITSSLLNGALNTLKKHGAKNKNIIVRHVPGSFELTIGAQLLAESYDVDAIICLGCVIQGETPHFTYICQGVTYGITKLNLDYGIPFIFGVLTTLNHDQALERSGGKHGNKGDEAAVTAIKMVALDREI
ncbi:MAG TPA: 6,7-dimethyl-8-ribityllumazine synthase [Bacteroidales bacterium]|jgi:6,7-dimethyl-8-ribityllumazine synthase|nr:6,7-dimethyl-8-ribityllumazine synthase [Bacteroidales bacterium]HOG56775.1 6,7-dimethyl-8-ribityllumazine synthase [Bacteroidales bacterium]